MDELTRDAIRLRRRGDRLGRRPAHRRGGRDGGRQRPARLPGPRRVLAPYPPYARLGLGFAALADPRWFRDDPRLAWGFYGHRLNLYRETEPHAGFGILRRWAGRRPLGAFVYTSNVDGQFQCAGFDPDRVDEVHGSIHHLQCTSRCGVAIFEADGCEVEIDPTTMRAVGPLPRCPSCGALARPNILMFGDGDWDDSRSSAQRERLQRWLGGLPGGRLVAVECGAGTAIPTVRMACETLAERFDGLLLRINPREPEVPAGHLGLSLGAWEALEAIDDLLSEGGDLPRTP